MKAVRFMSKASESMSIVEEAVPMLKAKEVLVKIAFTAVNRVDVLQRIGAYLPPKGASDIIGLELSGVVKQIGVGATKSKVGDSVMALLPGGGYAEYAAVHEDHIMPIPKGLTLREAAAIPEVWLTAFQLLRLIADTRSGDRVLVHAAASGVGTAALQMVRHWGAISMATVGSPQKVDLCRSLGAQLVVNRKEDAAFNARVKEFTDGHGADIILDCVGGSYWEKNADALAMDGTWVLYGLLGGPNVDGPFLRHLMAKRARVQASTLRSRSDAYKASLIEAFSKDILPHITRDGPLRPIIDTEFPLEETGAAHRHIEANANLGKILIRVGGEGVAHEEL